MWGWFSQSPWGGAQHGCPKNSNESQNDDIEMTEQGEQSPGTGRMRDGENWRIRGKRRRDERQEADQIGPLELLGNASALTIANAGLFATNPAGYLAQEGGFMELITTQKSQADSSTQVLLQQSDKGTQVLLRQSNKGTQVSSEMLPSPDAALLKRLHDCLAVSVDVVYANSAHGRVFGPAEKDQVSVASGFASRTVLSLNELGDESKQCAALKALFLLLKAEQLAGPLAQAIAFMTDLEMKLAGKQVAAYGPSYASMMAEILSSRQGDGDATLSGRLAAEVELFSKACPLLKAILFTCSLSDTVQEQIYAMSPSLTGGFPASLSRLASLQALTPHVVSNRKDLKELELCQRVCTKAMVHSNIVALYIAFFCNLRSGGASKTFTVIAGTLMVKLSGLSGRGIDHLSSLGITAANDTAVDLYKAQAKRRLKELNEKRTIAATAPLEDDSIPLGVADNYVPLSARQKLHMGGQHGNCVQTITLVALELRTPMGGLLLEPNRPPAFPQPTRALIQALLPIFQAAVNSSIGFGVRDAITTTRRNVSGDVRLGSFDAYPPSTGSSASESNLIAQMFVLFMDGHLGKPGRDKFLSVDPEPARVLMNVAAKSHDDVKNIALPLSAFHTLLWSMKLALAQPPLVLVVLGSVIRFTGFRVLTYRKIEQSILTKLESNRPGDVPGLMAEFAAGLVMGQEGPLPADDAADAADAEGGEEGQAQHAPGLQVAGLSDATTQLCVRISKATALYIVSHRNATIQASTSTKLKEAVNAAAQDEFKHGRNQTEIFMNSKTSKHIFDGILAGLALVRPQIEALLKDKPWSLGVMWLSMLDDEILSTIKPYKHMVENGEMADLYDSLPRTMLLWISYGGHPRLIQSCMAYVVSIAHLVEHRPDLLNALAENGKALTEAFIEHLHSVLKGLVDNLGGLPTFNKVSLCTVLHKDLAELHSALKKVYGRFAEEKPHLDAHVIDRSSESGGLCKKRGRGAAAPNGRASETCQQSMDWEDGGVFSKDAVLMGNRLLSDATMWSKFDESELLRQSVTAEEIAALKARSPREEGLALLPQFLNKISDDLDSIVAEDAKLKIDANMSRLLFWLNQQMGSTLDELLVRLRSTRTDTKELTIFRCGTTMATKIVALEDYMTRHHASPAASIVELERLCLPGDFSGKMRPGVAFKVMDFDVARANQADTHSRFERARVAMPGLLDTIYAEKYNDLEAPRQKNK